jgi:hypothetical protein
LDIDGSTATASVAASQDAGLAARVIALGRRGCSRAEVGPAVVVRTSGFPAAPRDANGRFLPGAPGRQPGQRNLISGRVTRQLLRNFEANQDELVARMQRWHLPQYMQLMVRLLVKSGGEGGALDELDVAELTAALNAALAAGEAG